MILFLIEIYLYQIVDIVLRITLTLHNIRISGSHHFYPSPPPTISIFILLVSSSHSSPNGILPICHRKRSVRYLQCQSRVANKAISRRWYLLNYLMGMVEKKKINKLADQTCVLSEETFTVSYVKLDSIIGTLFIAEICFLISYWF